MPLNQAPQIYRRDPYVHGSSQWASREHLKSRGFGEKGRYLRGYGQAELHHKRRFAITSSVKSHYATIGKSRSGKDISVIIPDCLTHEGSMVALDPKDAELALTTALTRQNVHGQRVILIDPFDCASSKLGLPPSGFNPLARLAPESPNFFNRANLIAESIVIQNSKDPFWSEECQALLCGLILFVRICPESLLPNPNEGRTLGQVRDCLNLPPKQFNQLISGEFKQDENEEIYLIKKGMAQSSNRYVRAAAGRIQNKSSKERSGVISTAHANTHFLEGPIYRNILSRDDYDPNDLEKEKLSVYFCMSAGEMIDDNRILRLFISDTMQSVIRFKNKPNSPILFMLEEFGTALGHLKIIEKAFGLMAGYGMTIHIVLQDLSQLRIYENWETFLSNCGMIQVTGVFDDASREYFSKQCGTTTVEFLSGESAAMRASLTGDPDFSSTQDQIFSRRLITPEEINVLHPAMMLLIIAGCHPVICYKSVYFMDAHFRDKNGAPLFTVHPDHEDKPLPPPVNFYDPNVDIEALLEPIFYSQDEEDKFWFH